MRKLSAGAAFLVIGLGAASNASAQLNLKGSDTLEFVTKRVINSCVAGGGGLAAGAIVYVGGGSGAGEAAMSGGTQQIAPMSRELNGRAGVDGVKCRAGSSQLLLGLDGIAIVAANQVAGDSQDFTPPPNTADDCSDDITSIASLPVPAGCTAAEGCVGNTYSFPNWQAVLAMIYGGQNNLVAGGRIVLAAGVACAADADCAGTPGQVCVPTGLSTAGGRKCGFPLATGNVCASNADCAGGDICYRTRLSAGGTSPHSSGPARRCGAPNSIVGSRIVPRVDCNSNIRRALADNWGMLFADVAGVGPRCRTGACTKLRHALRRDDLSGTTDTFVTLVGLQTIANPTTAMFTNASGIATDPMPDVNATASPFCNAGESRQNKGDSDYLDLDPIRRACDVTTAGNRQGMEEVCQGYAVPNNNDAPFTIPGGGAYPDGIPEDHSSATGPGFRPAPDQTGSGTTTGLLANDIKARVGLGLVLPIAMPGNYNTLQQAFAANAAGTTVVASPGVKAAAICDSRATNSVCPDGRVGGCLRPVNTSGGANFNVISDSLPFLTPVRDNRMWNLQVVTATGNCLFDNYTNSSITLAANRQFRVVSAFYRLHTRLPSTLRAGETPRINVPGDTCRTFSATEQIGCLVKANACNIGYAGREAVDTTAAKANFAFRINGLQPTTTNIQHLVDGAGLPPYKISRTLWTNSEIGFGAVAGNEALLMSGSTGCFGDTAAVDSAISAENFVTLPAIPAFATTALRTTSCPSPFPLPAP